MIKKQVLIFIGLALVIFSIFYFAKLEVFDGVIDFKTEFQEFSVEKSLSIDDLLNKNSQEAVEAGVIDVRLKPVGWMLMFILFIGLPGLIAYRFGLRRKK